MARTILIVLSLAAVFATAACPIASADVSPQAKLAMARRHAVASAHHHAAVHSARKVATRGGESHSGAARRHVTRRRRVGSPRTSAPAAEPVALQSRKRVVNVSPLVGSAESLARQNDMADSEGLERILDEDDLADRIAQKLLVPVPASAALVVSADLPENHKYCRPWTANFLTDLAKAYSARFGHPIEVNSAVRTVEYQKQLKLINGNAAAAEGDVVSPHLTGATVDVAKQDMGRAELNWVRSWLLPLQLAGTIDVEEEFRQRCFHISVYKNYVAPPPAPVTKHRGHRVSRSSQAASRDL